MLLVRQLHLVTSREQGPRMQQTWVFWGHGPLRRKHALQAGSSDLKSNVTVETGSLGPKVMVGAFHLS